MTDAAKATSREKQINQLYSKIVGIPDPKTRITIPGTDIAEPGDLLFFITHYSAKPSQDKNRPKSLKELVKKPP
jgi:hypothetical protein